MSRSKGEAEEAILTHPFHAKPYIKKIDFLKSNHPPEHEHSYEKLSEKLKADNIPYELHRKWHKLNEDLVHGIVEFIKFGDTFEGDLRIEIE